MRWSARVTLGSAGVAFVVSVALLLLSRSPTASRSPPGVRRARALAAAVRVSAEGRAKVLKRASGGDAKAASADGEATWTDALFAQADLDGDGLLDKDEAVSLFNSANMMSGLESPSPAELRVLLLLLDANGDKHISLSELRTLAREGNGAPPPEVFDVDADGYVTHLELAETMGVALHDASFTSANAQLLVLFADKDADGKLSMEEMGAIISGEFERSADSDGGFSMYDTDGDGHVALTEFTHIMSSLPGDDGGAPPTADDPALPLAFMMADSNGDDRLDANEWMQAFGIV